MSRRMPVVLIQPRRGWSALNLRELWDYRDLLFILAARDVTLRYRQTVLGIIWVILQPLVAAIILTIIFGFFAHLPSDESPYLLFVFCGLLPWNLLTGALQRAGNSLIGESGLISKVYFPRMILPLSRAVAVLIDFSVTLIFFFALMLIFRIAPTWRMLALPFFLLLTLLTTFGVSLWLSALSVYYRDFVHIVPFLIQIWMYASPVVYSIHLLPERWRLLASFNPAFGFIEGFRWTLLASNSLTVEMVVLSLIAALGTFFSGAYVFRHMERGFADVI